MIKAKVSLPSNTLLKFIFWTHSQGVHGHWPSVGGHQEKLIDHPLVRWKNRFQSKTTLSNLVNYFTDHYVFCHKTFGMHQGWKWRVLISSQPFSRSWLQFFPEICSLLHNWLIFKSQTQQIIPNYLLRNFWSGRNVWHLPCPTRPRNTAWETGSWHPTPRWSSHRSGLQSISS